MKSELELRGVQQRFHARGVADGYVTAVDDVSFSLAASPPQIVSQYQRPRRALHGAKLTGANRLVETGPPDARGLARFPRAIKIPMLGVAIDEFIGGCR